MKYALIDKNLMFDLINDKKGFNVAAIIDESQFHKDAPENPDFFYVECPEDLDLNNFAYNIEDKEFVAIKRMTDEEIKEMMTPLEVKLKRLSSEQLKQLDPEFVKLMDPEIRKSLGL